MVRSGARFRWTGCLLAARLLPPPLPPPLALQLALLLALPACPQWAPKAKPQAKRLKMNWHLHGQKKAKNFVHVLAMKMK